jgi:hypothetical protein
VREETTKNAYIAAAGSVEYVAHRFDGENTCVGCCALAEVKRVVAMGGDFKTTLCEKLGLQCLEENLVWKIKPNDNVQPDAAEQG